MLQPNDSDPYRNILKKYLKEKPRSNSKIILSSAIKIPVKMLQEPHSTVSIGSSINFYKFIPRKSNLGSWYFFFTTKQMKYLPIDIWSKILVYVDLKQRIEMCDILVKSGVVKLDGSMFNTYMILLEQGHYSDTLFYSNEDTSFIKLDNDI